MVEAAFAAPIAAGVATATARAQAAIRNQDGNAPEAPHVRGSPGESSMSASSIPIEAAPAGPSVLVVEDEGLVRELIVETLREAGCAVTEAATADEAVRALKATAAPDILVTDVKLPGLMNGIDLAASVRSALPRMKVIVTSGHAPPQDAARVADAFLAKPFALKELLGEVRLLAAAH